MPIQQYQLDYYSRDIIVRLVQIMCIYLVFIHGRSNKIQKVTSLVITTIHSIKAANSSPSNVMRIGIAGKWKNFPNRLIQIFQ